VLRTRRRTRRTTRRQRRGRKKRGDEGKLLPLPLLLVVVAAVEDHDEFRRLHSLP